MSNRTRFTELDLLRFLAASAVMLFHYVYRGPLTHTWPGSFPLLGQVFKYGYLGVNVFFIISGFVILLTAYDNSAIGFVQARIIRLYPAYWICVTLTAAGIVLGGRAAGVITPARYLANLTMLHSFFGITDVSGVYWSLAVELKFYFLIFLVLVFRQIRRLRLLLGLWLALSFWLSLHDKHGAARFFLFPEWSSYFIAGAMLYLIHREGPSAYKLSIVTGCYLISVAYALGWAPVGGGAIEPSSDPAVLALLLALFYLIFLGIALRPRHPQVSSRFWLLGLITYPLYLLHQDLGFILLRSAPLAWNRYVLLAAVVSAMIALSWLVHIQPERWLASRLKTGFANLARVAKSLQLLLFQKPRPADLLIQAAAPSPTDIAQPGGELIKPAPATGK